VTLPAEFSGKEKIESNDVVATRYVVYAKPTTAQLSGNIDSSELCETAKNELQTDADKRRISCATGKGQ
jgi:hypothetical protein